MAKEVYTFDARLWLNTEKGGAWIAEYTVGTGQDVVGEYSAWKNASAAKRWFKAKVQEKTTRKSVKLIADNSAPVDAKGKPTKFYGVITFRK